MTRKIFSIIFYVVAGFFFYMVGLIGYFNAPSLVAKLGLMVFFGGVGGLFLVAGGALVKFRHWMRNCGIVFLSSAAFTALVVSMIVLMFASENVREMMSDETRNAFGAYLWGTAVIVAFAGVGGVFLKLGLRTAKCCNLPELDQ